MMFNVKVARVVFRAIQNVPVTCIYSKDFVGYTATLLRTVSFLLVEVCISKSQTSEEDLPRNSDHAKFHYGSRVYLRSLTKCFFERHNHFAPG